MSGSIVVPLDGSRNAENAIPWAALLARLYDATVEFVHVVDHEGVSIGALPAAQSKFEAYTAELAATWGITNFHASVMEGNAAPAITAAAAGAKFVVIASHGHGGFRAAFIGSVADKVVRASTSPVVLVPAIGAPAQPGQRTVLVALDGSESAERGLELGREIAGKIRSSVTLVRAWAFPVQATGGFEGYYPAQELFESIEGAAKEYLAAKALPGEEQFVVMGYAATAIGNVAAGLNPELVVVTTSGKGLAARIALGSTTERLAHSLHRPLLIVPVAG